MERDDQRKTHEHEKSHSERKTMLDEGLVGTNINPTPRVRPDRDEEVARELSQLEMERYDDIEDTKDQASSVPGWIAIVLSILSFFMMPIILGGAGIIVGFIARNRDSEWLGNTAIAAGVISILITLFVRPYVS